MPAANKKIGRIALLTTATLVFFGSLYVNYANVHANSRLKYGISDISDKYFNLLTPAGFTFGIWNVIYVLGIGSLGLWWMMLFQAPGTAFPRQKKSIIIFNLAAIFNLLWVIVWTQDKILLSWMIMLILLILLAVEFFLTRKTRSKYKMTFYLFFNTYFGWITAAFAVNTVVVLVALGWEPMDVQVQYIAIMILFMVFVLAFYMLWFEKNYPFALAVIWAFFGIYISHRKIPGSYPIATNSLLILWLVLIGVTAYKVADKYRNYEDNF